MTNKNGIHKNAAYVEHMNATMKHFELSIPIRCEVKMKFSTFEDSLSLMDINQMKHKITESEDFLNFPHEIYISDIDYTNITAKEEAAREGLILSFYPKELSVVEVSEVSSSSGNEILFKFHKGNPYYR